MDCGAEGLGSCGTELSTPWRRKPNTQTAYYPPGAGIRFPARGRDSLARHGARQFPTGSGLEGWIIIIVEVSHTSAAVSGDAQEQNNKTLSWPARGRGA